MGSCETCCKAYYPNFSFEISCPCDDAGVPSIGLSARAHGGETSGAAAVLRLGRFLRQASQEKGPKLSHTIVHHTQLSNAVSHEGKWAEGWNTHSSDFLAEQSPNTSKNCFRGKSQHFGKVVPKYSEIIPSSLDVTTKKEICWRSSRIDYPLDKQYWHDLRTTANAIISMITTIE